MKFVEVPSLFDGDRAHIACLATYQFDPDFFERRLLRCSALQKARRIVVFVDRSEWFALLRRDVPARYVNRRYLVVPVRHATGRFHPKLALLLAASGGRVLCGSNNLTRAGCSSNLELLNAVCFEFGGRHEAEIDVAKEAFAFFDRAAAHADEAISRIVREWLDDAAAVFPWLRRSATKNARTLRLVHTYDEPLWTQLTRVFATDAPKDMFITSPFHDRDGRLFARMERTLPGATIEVLAQQGYTTLPTATLKKLRRLKVSEILETSRRLHAKLLAWRHRTGESCLIGSANFTCNAFDGPNVETCLLLTRADGLLDALFDGEIKKRRIAIDDFEPGVREPPPADDPNELRLNIESALLDGDRIRVAYSHNAPKTGSLELVIRAPGERHPRFSIRLPNRARGNHTADARTPAFAEAQGALLANLVAEVEGRRSEGPLVWVIQEDRLTFEPSEGGGATRSRVEETGEGLHDLLDEIGQRDGIRGIVEFLQHFNIRFYDGDGSSGAARRFKVTIRDPFQPDVAPDWLKGASREIGNLQTALMDFVERHNRRRLRRHATRGNVNGMENFLDIFTALVRILYVYAGRGIVKWPKVVERYCRFIEVATKGSTMVDDPFDGYLTTIVTNIGRGRVLRDRCDETNYLAVIYSALLIAREIRARGEANSAARDFLPTATRTVESAITACGLHRPPRERVKDALAAYRMLTDDQIRQLLAQLD